jgi:hypothetical protein
MKVRMTKFWRGHRPGEVLDVGKGVADVYVNYARVAVLVEEGDAPAPPAVEHMVPRRRLRVKAQES